MTTLKKLIIFSVSFIACFFVGIIIDLACGGEMDPYDYYVSFFHNNVQGEHNYGAFYLSYNYVFDDAEPESEADINCKEWAVYLNKKVTAIDVKKAMYGLSLHDDSVMLHDMLIAKNKLPDSLKSNRFLVSLTAPENKHALQYYLFAKGIENAANVVYDRWDPRPVDTVDLESAGMEALQKAQAETDNFIKLRYLYQAERLLHYAGNFKQAMAVYDDNISHLASASHVKGWALSLKAGEERKLGDTVKAAYLFSKVFASYPERRVQAYKNYHYCSVKAEDVTRYASNNTEKAFIYTVDSFGNPAYNFDYLQKAYHYNPASDATGVLLVRELNKLEENYLTPKLSRDISYNYDFDKPSVDKADAAALDHIRKLQGFCVNLATDHKYAEPGIGYIAAAYLAWMKGDSNTGLNYLAKLDGSKLSNKLSDQKSLVNLLLIAQKPDALSPVNEASLLPALKWLDKKVTEKVSAKPQGNTPDEFYTPDNNSKFGSSARDFYNLVLAPAYLKRKDTIKAALCVLKSESLFAVSTASNSTQINSLPDFWKHYLHPAQINKLLSYKLKPVTDPYLACLAASMAKISQNDLYDLLGTAYLRVHNYEKAVAAFLSIKKVNKSDWPYLASEDAADPFVDQLADYPKIFAKPGTKLFDRLAFAQKMATLQKKIKSDPKNASSYYFQMATGLYNASHYGNAYYLISYEWSAYDYGRRNRFDYDNDYIKTKTAGQYYLKARQLSASPMFKAKCTFMAAKCYQKQIVAPEYFGNNNGDYDTQVRQNPYFAQLQKDYSKTAFYKTAVNECSYLRDYLASGKKAK
jgi:hypothetical protein